MERPCKCDKKECPFCHHWRNTPGFGADVRPAKIGAAPPRPRQAGSPAPTTFTLPCVHRSTQPIGEQVKCRKCANLPAMDVYRCDIHGKCVVPNAPKSNDIKCCRFCTERIAEPVSSATSAKGPGLIPVKMVYPDERRHGIYRGGIIQIHVTRACDRSCNNCTQGSNLKGPVHHMSLDMFRIAVDSLKDYFGVVGIFGGNPCIHPQFPELCTELRRTIPWVQRGLWSNHPKGKGRHCAITFNPAYSNLNVHQSQEAWDEFHRDWPECRPYLKGLDSDSRHSPPFVAMKDVVPDEQKRWELIANCDINKNWSALIGEFRGELRGYFCEIAAAQAMLHQDEPDYPDTGVPIVPGWWKQGQDAFDKQIRKHCHECGVPLRGHGALANSDEPSQFSATHASIYRTRGGAVQQVTQLVQLGKSLVRATDYIENARA